MTNWELLETVRSKEDNTVKQIYMQTTGQRIDRMVEVAYIDKNDGKDIFCVPTQTSCNLGCKFCHLTGQALPSDNLTAAEIVAFVNMFRGEGVIHEPGKPNINFGHNTLLVSYMGSGEPLMNMEGVLDSAHALWRKYHGGTYRKVRFGLASIIPSKRRMEEFTESVLTSGIDIKFHWSLHSPRNEIRKAIMPAALPLREAVGLVTEYHSKTLNAVEAHYTLLAGQNDTEEDARQLALLLKDTPIDLKVLRYSERSDTDLKRSEAVDVFFDRLMDLGVTNRLEYYAPPGNDIGASCGQFLSKGVRGVKERVGLGAFNPRGLSLNVVQ